MAIRGKKSKFSSDESWHTSCEHFRHIRTNPETGQTDYYFPLEITDQSIRILARERGLEIGKTRLGFRVFEAVMVPCKETATVHGVEVFINTPSDVQRRRYLEFIKDEMKDQEHVKQDGRCTIQDSHGGTKRCPSRIPNPDYIPGGDMPKTLPVRCEGCKFEPYRQAHTVIELSALDREDDFGEMESYEIPSPKCSFAADRYLKLRKEFVAFVKDRNPKLAPLAEKLADEYTKSEAGRELGDASSTVTSRTDKLKKLLEEFLDNIITF